jgi:hypothetical protein
MTLKELMAAVAKLSQHDKRELLRVLEADEKERVLRTGPRHDREQRSGINF